MKKYVNKLGLMFLSFGISVMSFASSFDDKGEFTVGEDGTLDFTGGGKKSTDYSGGFFKSIIDFIAQWQNGLIWVFVGVAVLAFIIGLYKYVANPDLTTVVVSLITSAIFILMAIQSRKILSTAVASEIDINTIKQVGEFTLHCVGI